MQELHQMHLRLPPDHGQQHLERGRRADGVGDIGGHQDDFARLDPVPGARNRDVRLALQDLDQRVIRRAMLAQLLARVKGEQGHRARGAGHERAADHGSFAKRDESEQGVDGGWGEFGVGHFWFGQV